MCACVWACMCVGGFGVSGCVWGCACGEGVGVCVGFFRIQFWYFALKRYLRFSGARFHAKISSSGSSFVAKKRSGRAKVEFDSMQWNETKWTCPKLHQQLYLIAMQRTFFSSFVSFCYFRVCLHLPFNLSFGKHTWLSSVVFDLLFDLLRLTIGGRG